MTVKIFLLFIAAGSACGTINGLLHLPRQKAGAVFTVLTDIVLAFLLVGAMGAIIYFYCDGAIYFYAAAAEGTAFLIFSSAAKSVTSALSNHQKKHKKHIKERATLD